jgi:hypothetical protein
MAQSEKMSEEPTIDEIPEDANQPATRRDVVALRHEINAISESVSKLRTEILGQVSEMRDEILRHFDVAVENIEDSLRGANADEISLMKNNLEIHKERLDVLEERVRLR